MLFPPSRKLFAIVFIYFAACTTANGASTSSVTPTPDLTFYQTATPSQLPQNQAEIEIPLPSPTPYLYTVVAGDTMFTIAARLEIDLDALLAANPDVDPRFLSPGTELLIPADGAASADLLPSPTPVPVDFLQPVCYFTAINEVLCFVLVTNHHEQPLENIIALVQLLSRGGELLKSVEAFPPMNLLHSGDAMPLIAYFEDPPESWASAKAQLISSYTLTDPEELYLDAELTQVDFDISESGLAARVSGEIGLADTALPKTIWVLAVAYSEDGEVAGFRRWESDGDNEFNFWVYSLGPEIAEVHLLVEARR